MTTLWGTNTERKRELDRSIIVNFAKVGCVACIMHFPLGWVKCEMGIGGQSVRCPPHPQWLCTGGKEESSVLDSADSGPSNLEYVCVSMCSGTASGSWATCKLFFAFVWTGYWLLLLWMRWCGCEPCLAERIQSLTLSPRQVFWPLRNYKKGVRWYRQFLSMPSILCLKSVFK